MEATSDYTSSSTISIEHKNVRAGDQLRYLSHKASQGDIDIKNRLLDSGKRRVKDDLTEWH